MYVKVGDKVNWLYEQRGGYGFSINVAAVVTKVGNKKVQVRAAMRSNGEWLQVKRWVDPMRLSNRVNLIPEVDNA